MKLALTFLFATIALWLVALDGPNLACGQSTNSPQIDPTTDICTNDCPPDPTNPPVALSYPKTFYIEVNNVPLTYTNPLARTVLYEATNYPQPLFWLVTNQPYAPRVVFAVTVQYPECFWTASNLIQGINLL
jgi:hypothetical protein